MMNYIVVLLALLITCSSSSNGKGKAPVPPQPSQYTVSILFNGKPGVFYADAAIYRDRLHEPGEIIKTITDFQNYLDYSITDEACVILSIPNTTKSLLAFPTYDFNGTVTYNGTLCYKWTGCHYYVSPPIPFVYYATVKGNIPMRLNHPTSYFDMQFINFTFGPPPSRVFDIPKSCTKTAVNPRLHPILSHKRIKNSGVATAC